MRKTRVRCYRIVDGDSLTFTLFGDDRRPDLTISLTPKQGCTPEELAHLLERAAIDIRRMGKDMGTPDRSEDR